MKLFKRKNPRAENQSESDIQKSRYSDSPMDLFFESLILDTIGVLPSEKNTEFNALNLHETFKVDPMDWKLITKKVLDLSDTIEIAILDLWIRNRDIATGQNIKYEPSQFAIGFVENYYKEDSKVDVWEGDNLEQAKRRIEEYQSKTDNNAT